MKKNTMKTNIGTIDLTDIEFGEDSLDVFIPIVTVSENLKATIDKHIEVAKEDYQKEFLNCRGMNWSKSGVVITYQSLHVAVVNRTFSYKLYFGFEDKETDRIYSGFDFVVDLSEHETELKKLILNAMIDKFF